MRTSSKVRRMVAAIVATGGLAAGSAWAHLITSMAVPGNFVFSGFIALPGMTTPGFALAAGERIVVTFSAECAVNALAGDFTANTDVDIVMLAPGPVVVQTLSPTPGASDIFCSANGTAGFDSHARNSITVVGGGLPANVYQVQVRARTNGPAGTQAWYGDRALVVSR